MEEHIKPINILMVEDNPGDVELTRAAFKSMKLMVTLFVCQDGIEAMDFLYKRNNYSEVPRPDLILLDLNLPRMSGQEILAEISKVEDLRMIPLVVLTTSGAEEDINHVYKHCANCYVKKPVNFDRFVEIVKKIEDFWFTVVILPTQ